MKRLIITLVLIFALLMFTMYQCSGQVEADFYVNEWDIQTSKNNKMKETKNPFNVGDEVYLEPCPFCGKHARERRSNMKNKGTEDQYQNYIFGCVSPHCEMQPKSEHLVRSVALRKWNKRPKTKKTHERPEPMSVYQELFDHMDKAHNKILTQGELDEIIEIVSKMGVVKKKQLIELFEKLKLEHELPNDNTYEYKYGFVAAMNIAINEAKKGGIDNVPF